MKQVYHSINKIAKENLNEQHIYFLKEKYGLNINTIKAFEVGFIVGEKDFKGFSEEDKLKSGFYSLANNNKYCYVNNFFTFPIYFKGEIVGFWTRSFRDTNPKNLYLKNKIEFKNRITNTYNNPNIPFSSPDSFVEDNKKLILCEGAGDAMSIAQNIKCKVIAYGTSQIPDKYIPFIVDEAKK